MTSIPAAGYLMLAVMLFCIGLYGVLTKRNIVIVLICIEVMLNAVNLNFVTFSKFGMIPGLSGQIFTLFTIAIAAAEASVALAILMALYRNKEIINIDEMNQLKK